MHLVNEKNNKNVKSYTHVLIQLSLGKLSGGKLNSSVAHLFNSCTRFLSAILSELTKKKGLSTVNIAADTSCYLAKLT